MSAFEKLFGDKFSKFRLGQLLFITAITFGLFAGDVIRRSIAVLALFCLSSENFKFAPWTKEQKITGLFLALFCAWMLFIPLIFGEADFPMRTHCATRSLEITLWICVTFLFAKDEFFIKNYKNFAVFFCFLYATVACIYAVQNHFPFAYSFANAWPFLTDGLDMGAVICGLTAWIIADIVTAKNIFNHLFSAVTLLLATVLVLCSRYTTFWVALLAEFVIAMLLLCIYHKKASIRFVICVAVIFSTIFLSLNIVMKKDPAINSAIRQEIDQLTVTNTTSLEHFTNHRNLVWQEIAGCVVQKPVLGYGHDIIYKYNANAYNHAHNTFLNTAFVAGIPAALLFYAFLFMLFFLALKFLFKAKMLVLCPFVTILMLITFNVAGLTEDMFIAPARFRVILYIPVFVTMLNLYNTEAKR